MSTPVISWVENFQWLLAYHYIAGYSASTIAMIRFGTGTSVDTGSNYSSITSHLTQGSTTLPAPVARASQAGLQVANDAVSTGRRGHHQIWNPATEPKSCQTVTETFSTKTPTTAAASQTTISTCYGTWWNTADQIHCCDMVTPTGTLDATSYLEVYGLYGRL